MISTRSLAAILAATALAPAAAQNLERLSPPAAKVWREPVATAAELPTCDDRAENHVRLVLGEVAALYLCDGATWSPQGTVARGAVGALPACAAGLDGILVVVTDPDDSADCTSGGGTAAPHGCVCDGGTATWRAVGSTGGGDLGLDGDAIRFIDSPGAGQTIEVLHVGTEGGTLVVEPLDVTRSHVTANDDGRTRGAVLFGPTYCSGSVRCAEGQGGCNNTDGNCQTGLFCRQNVGRLHAVAANLSGATLIDICLPNDYWCARTCTAADPCRAGQGDCAGNNANCAAGLVCTVDNGAAWDCGATVDVCQAPASTCANACSGINQCATGTGSCSAGLACLSGICTAGAGAYYGCPPATGICE